VSNPELVLASSSTRRRVLFEALGLPFVASAADVDESQLPGETPPQLVQRLSVWKAHAVAGLFPDAVVIGADTVVVLDGLVLGKPDGHADAACMLRALRSRDHQVFSAVTALRLAERRSSTELSESRVWMRDYSDDEIAGYVAGGDPLDKAGAYAIQHPGFAPVERYVGCYAGIMGLPLCHLVRALAAVGFSVRLDPGQACYSVTGMRCLCSPQQHSR
jgi:septum formation protein